MSPSTTRLSIRAEHFVDIEPLGVMWRLMARPTPIHVCVVLAAVLAVAACSSPPDTVPAPSGLEATPTPGSPDPSPTPSPPSLEEAGFAGLFLAPDDNSILYVYLENPSQAAAEAAAAKHFGIARMQHIREVRPLKARYTMKQLAQLKTGYSLLQDLMSSLPEVNSSVNSSSLDLKRYRIVIGVDCESDLDPVRMALKKGAPPLGVPIEAVVVEVRERPRYRLGGFECISAETIDPATGLSTPGFGGLYWESDVVYVYLLEPSQEVAEELVIEQWGRKTFESLQGVRAVQGTYTWAQLLEWYEAIDYHSVSVDSRRNRLTIEVRPEEEGSAERRIKAILSRHAVPCEAVLLLRHDGTTRPPASPLCPP